MWTWLFWKSALERAIKTFAQVLIGALSGTALGLADVPWGPALSVAALAAVLSLLTSLVSGLVPTDPVVTPSVVTTIPEPRRPLPPEGPASA